MDIQVICPAPRGSRSGNRVTAERWAAFLRGLGHRVAIRGDWRDERCDLLIALHARRSGAAARRFHRAHPDRPLVVALTGTDVYRDLRRSEMVRGVLDLADAIVTLQRLAVRELPGSLRKRVRTIHQSVPAWTRHGRRHDGLVVSVLGHLRPVKDPFRAAAAARRLPAASTVRVVHAGGALSETMRRKAMLETVRNPRYRWVGSVSRSRARTILAGSDVTVVSSRAEGGAHVVGEAAVAGVPVLASRIPGNVGLLGASYPGYFPAGDTTALAGLLTRFEHDGGFRRRLRDGVRRIAPLFDPRRERRAWQELLADVTRRR